MIVAEPLTFDPITHAYTLDGLPVPSVTQILRGAGLIQYDADPATLEYARARGTAVHAACHYLAEGDLDERTVAPEISPYVDAYRRFLAESDFVCRHIEARVYSRVHRYAGTLDRAGTIGEHSVLLDLKTGPPESWTGAQLAGYEIALRECEGVTVDSRFSLHLKADGRYSIQEYHAPQVHRHFLAALAAWRKTNA